VTHAERYIELALRLARHEPELLDSYYGPQDVSRRVGDEPLLEPRRLADDAAALLAELDDGWLEAQVRALETTARRFAGDDLPYAEEVELTYGIRPRWVDEREFERAHASLDEALPGSGDLARRLADWLDRVALPRELVGPAMGAAIELVRDRTRAAIELPPGEEVELEVVTGERWLGYAHYLGDFRTHISVNTDLPFPADGLLVFAAHEAYPGHHTHRAWQEAELSRAQGRIEATLDLLWSPDAVITEGIAETAPLLVLDGAHTELAKRLAGLGFDYDGDRGARVSEGDRLLKAVWSNASILLHDRAASREEAWEYAANWSLLPPDHVDKFLANVEDRGSRGYTHCYDEGLRLCSAYVGGDPARLRQLMTARVLPSDLASSAAA
jgi:hypothetical protein